MIDINKLIGQLMRSNIGLSQVEAKNAATAVLYAVADEVRTMRREHMEELDETPPDNYDRGYRQGLQAVVRALVIEE